MQFRVQSFSTRTKSRGKRGAATAIVAMVCLLVVISIVLLFNFMVFMGGSQEVKNSVDAAALNIANRAPEIKLGSAQIQGYGDVADSTHCVGLMNVNRVWGRCFLVNANQADMQNKGQSTSVSSNDANMQFEQAEAVNAQLTQMLNNKSAIDVYFNDLAQNKPAKLLGLEKGAVSNADTGNKEFATACVYKGDESNLIIADPQAIPGNPVVQQIKHGSTVYFQGYNPSEANSKHFCFSTFHANESPHLIASSMFDLAAKTPVANAINPVPNAFREAGQIKSNLQFTSIANAVANPQRFYQLAIPHSYVIITITNKSIWTVQGKQVYQQSYNYNTGKVWGVKSFQLKPPAQGILNGYATLGLEYEPNNNLLQAVQALPGDHTAAFNVLLQRVKEFAPGYSLSNLKNLLQSVPLSAENTPTSTYFIYPVYNTPDNTSPTVKCSTQGLPSWFEESQPVVDGEPAQLLTEGPVTNEPNTCFSNIIGPYPTDKHFTTETGVFAWTPGTGYPQCLGVLSILRTTQVTFTGLPP